MEELKQEAQVHFLYSEKPDKSSLCQGDLLEITDDLMNVLNEVHPYFAKSQYKHFIVITQSCDLVRRDGKRCKSPYITLAAVQCFDDFFKKVLLRTHYIEQVKGMILMDSKMKAKAYQLIERVFNNTEPDYFFLYKEDKLQLYESMVAFLKV